MNYVCLSYLCLPNYLWSAVRITLFFYLWLKVRLPLPPLKKFFDFKYHKSSEGHSTVVSITHDYSEYHKSYHMLCPIGITVLKARVDGSNWWNWDT